MKQKGFDVVIADYIMPGKDDLEFLQELRRKGNNIPFIIFTGKGREREDLQRRLRNRHRLRALPEKEMCEVHGWRIQETGKPEKEPNSS